MGKIADKAKDKISSFTTGEEGSVFWLIKWTIGMIKVIIESLNDQLRLLNATQAKRKEDRENAEE